MVTPDRLAQLLKMLERQPRDPFLLYGVAMEHRKRDDPPKALEYLSRAIEVDPNYCYAYYQQGQVLESTGDTDAARRAYLAGIDAALRTGDEHARSELQAALDLLT
jgi:tetratricopeptide (TPR) repeat protein